MVWIKALILLIKPNYSWNRIAESPVSITILLLAYILPIAFIASVIQFISLDISVKALAFHSLLNTLTILISITLGSFMIWRLAPRFSSEGSYLKVLNLSAMSYTPVFYAFIFASLHPKLDIIKLLGLYSVYLYWTGLSFLTKTPDDRKAGFTIISVIIFTGIGYLLSVLLNLPFL